MNAMPRFIAGVAAGILLCVGASASEVLVEISGVYSKSAEFERSFGSSDSRLPLSISFVIDETRAVQLAAETPFMQGKLLTDDALFVPSTGIISLTASLGSARWTELDVDGLPYSDLEFRPAVILLEEGERESVRVYMSLSDREIGQIILAQLLCPDIEPGSACKLLNNASASEFQLGPSELVGARSSGSISQLSIKITKMADAEQSPLGES